MNNKKIISFLILFFFIILLNIFPIVSVSAKNDDDLGIKEGESYTWTTEVMDKEKYMKAYDHYPYFIFAVEGKKQEYHIEYIYEDEDYWKIEVELKIYKTYTDKNPIEININIPKKGENYNPDYIPSYPEYILVPFIPNNAEDYLDDWNEPSGYSVDGLEITHEDGDIERTWVYQDNGVLSSYIIKYEGDVIYRFNIGLRLISFGHYFLGFMAIAVIGIIIIIIRKYRGANKR